VISLAGVALIFGQDTPPPRDIGRTAPLEMSPGRNDRPTAAAEHNTVDIRPEKKIFKEDSTNQ
jgi:hypothetical protein